MSHERPKETAEASSETKSLPNRVEAVALYGTGRIETKPGDTEQAVLSTEKLNGCTAVILFREYENGNREAQMTHFPPLFLEKQLARMGEFQKNTASPEQSSKAFIYLERGRAENAQKLEDFIKTELGISSPTLLQAYDRGLSRENAGILKLTVPPEGTPTIETETGVTPF